jgi:hypothetical protein
MTEYDYSPEAYERYMATQTRISNWVNSVSQSMQTPSPSSRHSSDYHHSRSRPIYAPQQPHFQSQPRSNSLSRSQSRGHHQYHQEPSRPRSHSYSNSRPQASRFYSQPNHSRTYSYALNLPPPPAPIPVPQPVSHLHPVPRRSRTLPPQSQNVLHYTYDAPRGGPTYVIVPPVGGGPHQIHMQSPVRTPHAFLFCRIT